MRPKSNTLILLLLIAAGVASTSFGPSPIDLGRGNPPHQEINGFVNGQKAQ